MYQIDRMGRWRFALYAPDTGGAAREENAAVGVDEVRPTADEGRLWEENLQRREAEVMRRELRAQALETLAGSRLPSELAELIDYTDAAACASSLSRVQKIWQQAVQRGVESRVAGSAPKAGNGKSRAHSSMREAISAYYNK